MVVWVVVASKYGATHEIAEAIAEEISVAGHEASVRDAEEIDGFEGADAVVLGSAVYGRWLKPARTLLDERTEELASKPLWLFSSGPLGDPPMPKEVEPDGIADAVEATGAREHKVFAGRLERGLLSRPERMIARALRAPDGDFRDWERVRAWARSIAGELRG